MALLLLVVLALWTLCALGVAALALGALRGHRRIVVDDPYDAEQSRAAERLALAAHRVQLRAVVDATA